MALADVPAPLFGTRPKREIEINFCGENSVPL